MTNKFESGITFFPEYTSASTAILQFRNIIQHILGNLCHRRAPKRSSSDLKPLLGPSSVPPALCETMAYVAFSCLAKASSDIAPLS